MNVNAFAKAIGDKMAGCATLVASIPGGHYHKEVPQTVTSDYISYEMVDAQPLRMFGDGRIIDSLWQFDIIAANPTNAGTIAMNLETCLEAATLTISGYSHIVCKWQAAKDLSDLEPDGSRIMIEYLIQAQKS
jgi:hypothetical protein